MKVIKTVYWITTMLVSLVFAMNCFMYFTRNPRIVTGIQHLGYPDYLLDILGVAKALGLIVLLIPKFPRLKEWAYAGFTIDLIGALWSHNATGDHSSSWFILILIILLAISYVTLRRMQLTLGKFSN